MNDAMNGAACSPGSRQEALALPQPGAAWTAWFVFLSAGICASGRRCCPGSRRCLAGLLAAVGLWCWLWAASAVAAPASAPEAAVHSKPRLVVMTDIGGDPDDRQSLVRFLLYACDFEVEGLCTGFGHGHYQQTRPDLIHEAVDAYARVLPNLRLHRADYPSAEHLRSLIKDGHNGDPHSVGPGMDSEASEWIIRVLERDDPRPVWFSIWGGPRELAQAIWKLQSTRSAEALARLKRKIRVHSIADQDRTARWVKEHHPDVFWIYSKSVFRGMYAGGQLALVSPEWLKEHVLEGHGPLGAIYPAKAAGKDGVKEGDTPSFFYVLPNGLSDPEKPEWGGWGGRFRPSGHGHEYIDAEDLNKNVPDALYTIHRWREAYQNAFAARMDWCVKPYAAANHEPVAALAGDRSVRVVQLAAEPGAQVRLSAAGSTDPDGQKLSYRWWVYQEAGSYWAAPPIRGADSAEAVLSVPQDAAGRTIHVILEVTDAGGPPLTAYRRVVIEVAGQPVPPPPGVIIEEDLSQPVTSQPGPPGKPDQWHFWRGINVGGAAVKIDGHPWDGEDAAGFQCHDRQLVNRQVALRPPTDAAREQMIRSFRWNRGRTEAVLGDLPAGTYAVYIYVWEETAPATFDISLNGRVVARGVNSGPAGRWRRLGPWTVAVGKPGGGTEQQAPGGGTIRILATGGDANLSGIEIWRQAAD